MILWITYYFVVLLHISIGSSSSNSVNKLEKRFESNLDQYVITSRNSAYLPDVGNGHIATQVHNKCMFMNGIYNGEGINSHRACIPSTINWNISTTDHLLQTFYSLNTVIGVFKEIMIYKTYNVTLSTYVSRVSKQILVRNVSLEMLNNSQSVFINTHGTTFDNTSPDYDFSIHDLITAWSIHGQTKIPENNHSTTLSIFVIMEKIPKLITLSKSKHWVAFITSMDEFEHNALLAFNKAKSTESMLLSSHSKEWIGTWDDGLISVTSINAHVKASIHTAQYYLFSSLPNRNQISTGEISSLFYGLSPTGLAHGNTLDDYMGHVFWDMDTWMFPSILPFHKSLAIELIKYRSAMLNAALNNSKNSGYQGARYPWESARTGYETTFDAIVGQNEIHISSDISFAIQQLLFMSHKSNSQLYYKLGKDILLNIARFWASRVTYNETIKQFEILNVMPPDEYVDSCNNSAYTNIAAMQSLASPLIMAKRYNDNITDEMLAWFHMSEYIVYPYDEKRNFIFEYDGYKLGTKVKQADVVLLQFPFQFKINDKCLANNLNYYEKVTDVNGPAMTWAIFSINWFSLKEPLKAEQYFIRNFQYITSPYYVWTEQIDGKGAKNFLTGIGGYLQNILYGYMGMRLSLVDDGQLIFDPITTSLIPSIELHNVSFQNSNIDLTVNHFNMSIELLNEFPITVFTKKDQIKYTLTHDYNKITISNQMVVLTSS